MQVRNGGPTPNAPPARELLNPSKADGALDERQQAGFLPRRTKMRAIVMRLYAAKSARSAASATVHCEDTGVAPSTSTQASAGIGMPAVAVNERRRPPQPKAMLSHRKEASHEGHGRAPKTCSARREVRAELDPEAVVARHRNELERVAFERAMIANGTFDAQHAVGANEACCSSRAGARCDKSPTACGAPPANA